MKHTIGLIAPKEPETLALLTQQQFTWQQARRQAIRLLLSQRPATQVVADIEARYGIWASLATRFVRQAQSILHPQTTARQDYLAYLAACADAVGTADEIAFYQALPGPGDDALIDVDYRAPAAVGPSGDGMQLFWLPQAETFYLSVPVSNPGGTPGHISGLPVLFADAEAAELRRMATGDADLRLIDLPNQELVWWQGTPHLVVGFDPEDCVAAYVAIRRPSRTGKVTAAVMATLALQSSLPVIGAAMAQGPATTIQIAAAQTPTVKVLDSATGRQLGGVRLVAEDGKVLAQSDDSGTLVLPGEYVKYGMFNLVKAGYQFMLLESTQLTPHNLLRVEMSPVTAKGKASTQTAAITPPPALPGDRQAKAKTLTAAVQTSTPKPVTPQAAKAPPAARPTASIAARPPAVAAKPPAVAAKPVVTASVKPFTIAAKPPATVPKPPANPAVKTTQMASKPTTLQAAKPPMTMAAKPPVTVAATASHPNQAMHTTALKPDLAAAKTTKPAVEQHAKAVLPITKPVLPQHPVQAGAPKPAAPTAAKAPATAPSAALPKTVKPAKMAKPMAEVTQAPRAAKPATSYKVQPGDSLWSIADSQLGAGSRWMSIYQLNKGGMTGPDRLQVGQTLQLPSRDAVTTAAKAPTAQKIKITVRAGDSLSLIAQKRLGKLERWHEIYEMNRSTLRNPRWIFPGQQIWIPGN